MLVDNEGRNTKLSVDRLQVYRRPSTSELPNPKGLSLSSRTDNSRSRNLSPAEVLDAWLDSLRDPLQDLFSSLPDENARSPNEFFLDSLIQTTGHIAPSDPHGSSEYFSMAKKKEVEGLDAGRSVPKLKKAGTNYKTPKALFVAQGFSDREKDFIIHKVTSFRQRAVRIIVSFSSLHGYRIFSHDVTQAYTRSDDSLSRELFLQRKPTEVALFSLSKSETLKLVKTIYGSADASDYWNVTVDRQAKKDLGIEPMTGDSSLYIKLRQGGEAKRPNEHARR